MKIINIIISFIIIASVLACKKNDTKNLEKENAPLLNKTEKPKDESYEHDVEEYEPTDSLSQDSDED